VLEGRDIGTAVFPDATLKIYLNASVEERARRRAAETGDTDVAAMASKIAERDHLDMTRETDPLTVAGDALVIDSTSLTIDGVVEAIAEAWIERKNG
jgi:cytidylate kinase